MNNNSLGNTLGKLFQTSIASLTCPMAALSTAACALVLSTACGGAEMEATDLEFEEIEEALNSDPVTCGGAGADKTFDAIFSSFTSPSNYTGRNGCGNAYFADVTNYRNNNTGKYNYITWGEPVPTSQASCEAARLDTYVFDVTTSTPTFVGNKSRFGVWVPAVTFPPGQMCGDQPCIGNPAYCGVPRSNVDHTGVSAGDFSLTKNKKYKFAIRARDMSNPAAPVTKKIKFGNAPVVLIP
jgi:hypothetical protein